jgi:hypothetical protein
MAADFSSRAFSLSLSTAWTSAFLAALLAVGGNLDQ